MRYEINTVHAILPHIALHGITVLKKNVPAAPQHKLGKLVFPISHKFNMIMNELLFHIQYTTYLNKSYQ